MTPPSKLAWTLALCLAPAVRAEVFPPDGAHLLSSQAVIPLNWKLAGNSFSLSVSGSGRTVYEDTVSGSRHDLPVREGTLYRWNVVPFSAASAGGQFFSFQYHGSALRFFGKPANDFFKTPNRGMNPDGRHGMSGTAAPDLTVHLSLGPHGVQLRVENRDYLILDSSEPVLIQSVGGDGAPGEAGQRGAAGAMNALYSGAENGMPGGDGGAGGDGGRGGNIRVHTSGLPAERWLRFDVRGGQPGRGGPGGPGGYAGSFQMGRRSLIQGYSGAPGRAGLNGRPGADGVVQILP